MEKFELKYFLGTNSCEGFISSFDSCYDAKKGWKAYIIKGGPGTGKSSFMKLIAAKAAEKNIKTELCPCSSDPDSLDAVIFPEKRIVIMDGTAPHTLDPVYPAICEKILNFGEFWKDEAFDKNREEIIALTNKNKALHRSASRYLQAIGQLMTDNLKTASACTDKSKTRAFAERLCQKYIPKKAGNGYEWVRYLGGITPKGVIAYTNTILATAEKTVIIADEYGSATGITMNYIKEYSLKNGYEIITVKNSFLPSSLIDHIIIPELSLGFVRENEYQHFDIEQRRIHARRFVSTKQLKKSRERLRFNQKAIHSLLISAVSVLADAKDVHDDLEKYYIKAMDFERLNAFANKFAEKIF